MRRRADGAGRSRPIHVPSAQNARYGAKHPRGATVLETPVRSGGGKTNAPCGACSDSRCSGTGGYQVEAAESGNDALHKLQLRLPDAMIWIRPPRHRRRPGRVVRARPARASHHRGIGARRRRSSGSSARRSASDDVTKPLPRRRTHGSPTSRAPRSKGEMGRRHHRGDFASISCTSASICRAAGRAHSDRVQAAPTFWEPKAGRVVTHHQLLRDVWGPSKTDELSYLRV